MKDKLRLECHISLEEKYKIEQATKDVFTGRSKAIKNRKRPYAKKRITNTQLLSACIKFEKAKIESGSVEYDITKRKCKETKSNVRVIIENPNSEDLDFLHTYMCARNMSQPNAIKELLLNSNPYLTK